MVEERLGIQAVLKRGKVGQFDVLADGELIVTRGGNWFTRQFGAGWPEFEEVIATLEERSRGRA